MIHYQKDANQIVCLTLEMKNRPINLLGKELIKSLDAAITRLEKEKQLAGVILTSAKNDFIAGANLDELFYLDSSERAMETSAYYRDVVRRLESLGKPVVAAINGAALGGGYEVALACHYRIAVDSSATSIGFPEITLGLFPGGGGTQRLPRLIGIRKALPILLEGRRYRTQQALELGMVDALASDVKGMLAQARDWIMCNPEARQPWDRTGFQWPGGDPRSPELAQFWALAPAAMLKKTRGLLPAALHALAAVYEGSQVDFDTGTLIESRYFTRTVTGKTAKNMMTAFWYQMNRLKKGESRPADTPVTRVNKIGVLGAGMMGSGIALVAAREGIQVVLKDLSLELAERGKGKAAGLLARGVSKGKMTPEQRDAILDRILPTDRVSDLAGSELIIEAVFEDRELKARVTAEAEEHLSPEGIFASNTSTLPISGLAKRASNPGRFIGMHFFSPVDRMGLVEIITGKETLPATLAKAFDFVLQIKKTPIVVNDSRGFYTSRVFSTYIKEGMALLQEGQHPRAIESAGLQAGMPIGPLAVSDEVSLELIARIHKQTLLDMKSKGTPMVSHPADGVVSLMVDEWNRPGKKAGRGFYEYPDQGEKYLWPALSEHFPARTPMTLEEMKTRLSFVQALESVRCLEEGVLGSVADANIGSILGWGFSPYKGGTLQFINDHGLPEFVEKTEELAKKFGPRFEAPSLLKHMLETGERFQ